MSLVNRWHPDIPDSSFRQSRCHISYRMQRLDGWADSKQRQSWWYSRCKSDDNPHTGGPIHVRRRAHSCCWWYSGRGDSSNYEWGFTGILGGGFLTEHFPVAQKRFGIFKASIQCHGTFQMWDLLEFPIQDLSAPSHDLLYVRRVVGTNQRQSSASPGVAANHERCNSRFIEGSRVYQVAKEACRTIPPREHGGCDIKTCLGFARILSSLRWWRETLDGRHPLLTGRRWNHVLWCDEMAGYLDLHVWSDQGGVRNMVWSTPSLNRPHWTSLLSI